MTESCASISPPLDEGFKPGFSNDFFFNSSQSHTDQKSGDSFTVVCFTRRNRRRSFLRLLRGVGGALNAAGAGGIRGWNVF
jgi:hypothetical protein